jgi:alkylation response protein AidB-like acyl-CoA dehydrogenase
MAKKLTIEFSEEQAQLLDIATSFCKEKSSIADVRARIETDKGFDSAVWEEIAALGWLGIAIPEEFGGSELGLGEVVTIAEPMGRHLLATPFASTTLVAQALLKAGTDDHKSQWLPKICEGKAATLALAEPHMDWDLTHLTCTATMDADKVVLSGTKCLVTDALTSDLILVSVSLDGAPALVLVETSSLPNDAVTRETAIDETRRCYRICFDGVSVPAANLLDQSATEATLKHIHKLACLLLSAEMCGGIAATLDLVVEYLNTRKQFGRFIGSYQALKHPTVDILTGLEASRSHLYYAASVFDDEEEGEIAVRMAKAQASEAFSYAGDRAIQFHGGFGFTYECDAQLYRRRSIWCENQHGDSAYHRERLAGLLLDG